MPQNNNQNSNNINNLGTIRISGTVAMSRLITPNSYNGKDEYEVALNNVQFEDPSQQTGIQDPQVYQKCVESFNKRIKPAKEAGQLPVLWLKTPTENQNGKKNHVGYLDAKTQSQVPSEKELASGTQVTAYVNCFEMPGSAMLTQYDYITGRLTYVLVQDAQDDKTWWTPSAQNNVPQGFTMLSESEAYGNQAPAQPTPAPAPNGVNPSANEPFTNAGNQAPFGNPGQGQTAQTTQSTDNGLFGNTPQSPNAGSAQPTQNDNGGLFGNNNAQPQNGGGLFGNNNTDAQPQNGGLFGNTPQSPNAGNAQPTQNDNGGLFGNNATPQNPWQGQ